MEQEKTNEIYTSLKNDALNPEQERKILAQNLSFFRKKASLSQSELASKLNTSNKNISKWERAENIPDIFTIKKLASIFNISVDTLITPISNENKEAIKTKNAIPFKWSLYMLFMTEAIIILLAGILFFVLKFKNVDSFPLWYIYIYALPLVDLTVFLFICCTKKIADMVTSSLFGWLVTICFYITFKTTENIGYIFIIAIGWQILTPIISILINSGKIIRFNKMLLKKLNRTKKD